MSALKAAHTPVARGKPSSKACAAPEATPARGLSKAAPQRTHSEDAGAFLQVPFPSKTFPTKDVGKDQA